MTAAENIAAGVGLVLLAAFFLTYGQIADWWMRRRGK